jgi:hypothetical protein
MHKQWENVQAIIGYQILPKMLPLMVKFANILGDLSTWMTKHPVKFKWLVFALGGLGITLSILGKVLMTAGIIKFLGMAPMISGAFSAMGTGLTSTIGLISKLGPAAMVAAAGLAGFLVGKALNELAINPAIQALTGNKNATLGTWIYDLFHGPDHGTDATYVAMGKNRQPVQVTTHINLDSKPLAVAVTKHQEKALSRPQSGRSTFDGGLALAPVGASSNW